MTFISKNAYLSQSEMQTNARCVYEYLYARGWSLNAIAGMLGNMETESTINPGIWQNLDEGNTTGGFGLVQWTPATKYLEWVTFMGYEPTDLYGQLDRLRYEMEFDLQWIQTDTYPLSFLEFKFSELSPYYLAGAFLYNYERPANPDHVTRGNQAVKWFNYLYGIYGDGQGGYVPTPTPSKKKSLSLFMKYIASKKKV